MKKAISLILIFIILICSFKISVSASTTTDYSAFNSIYESALEYNDSDYSKESFLNLKELLDKHSCIYSGEKEFDQAYIDRACSDILSSIYELKAYFNIKISSRNPISIEFNNAEYTTKSNNYSVLQGCEIRLTAPEIEGYKFLGWFEETSKRYLSNDNEFIFIVSSNIKLEAIYSSNDSATLFFKNQSEQIIEAIEKTVKEWMNTNSILDIAPDVPYSFNKQNGSWVFDNDKILGELRTGANATIYPKYDTILESESKAPSNNTNAPKATLEFSYNKESTISSFLMYANIPNGCKINNVGIAFKYGSEKIFEPTKTILTIDNKSTISQFGSLVEDLYIVNTKTQGRSWAAVGFITYFDEENKLQTYYTNQVNVVGNEWINSVSAESIGYYLSLETAIEDANNLTNENSSGNKNDAVLSMYIKDNTAFIELLSDCEITNSIVASSNLNIDLNQNTITLAKEKELTFNNSLSICNGAIKGNDSIQLLNGEDNSILSMKDVKISQEISENITANSYLINTKSKEARLTSCDLSLTGNGKKGLTAISLNLLNSNGKADISDCKFYTDVENCYSNGNIEAVGEVNLYRNYCEIGRNRSSVAITSTSSDVWFHDFCFSMNPIGTCQLYVDGGNYDSNLGTIYSPEHDIANVAFKLRPKAVAGSIAVFEEKTAPLYVHGGNAGLSIQETQAYIYGGDFSSPDHGGIYSIATTEQPLNVYGGKFYTTTIEQDGVPDVVRYGAFYCGGNNVVNITNAEIVGGKFGIRLKAMTANKGSVTIQNSKVSAMQQAFSISQGVLTINKGTITSWNTKYPETEEAGGTLIDNR